MQGLEGLENADLHPASGDASFRRYFRVHSATASYIVMDAPPEQEDCHPFIQVAGYLESMQLHAPRVIVKTQRHKCRRPDVNLAPDCPVPRGCRRSIWRRHEIMKFLTAAA